MAPGYKNFEVFCYETGLLDPLPNPTALPSGVISDDEDEEPETEQADTDDSTIWQSPPDRDETDEQPKSTATTVEFNLDGPTKPTSEGEEHNAGSPTSTMNVIINEEDHQPSDLAMLLMLHHQYTHIYMRKMQEMAKQGIIPRRLSKCRIPTCSACLYAKKAMKRPWRGKETKKGKAVSSPTRPGHIVSVDQLVSPTPRLIAQMTGFLTTKRYKYATIYVDQFSRFGFVYLQKTASAKETVEGKKAFETMDRRHGIAIQNYHADNGIFKAYKWIETCQKERQGITFAGVNAHHQNGVAERRIRELQELARAMLIHANSRWSDSATANLWPYAIRNTSDAINATPSFQDPLRRSPTEVFTGAKVTSNPKHWKPFGCPTYVRDNQLQGQKPFHKWKQRVSLVLSRKTRLVSSQFHVAFDTNFDTVKNITTKSKWQVRT